MTITDQMIWRVKQLISVELIYFSFECRRIEEKRHLYDCVPYLISYYLEDNTISVKERKQRDESFDICPFLIKRIKVPKYPKHFVNSLIANEDDQSDEPKDFVQPNDFLVGNEVNLMGHRFIIRDCDARTRKYYEEILKVQQPERVPIDKVKSIAPRNVSSSSLFLHIFPIIFSIGKWSVIDFTKQITGITEIFGFWNTRRFIGIMHELDAERTSQRHHQIRCKCQ